MVDLGFNYRLTDLQCALGLSQLERLEDFLARRRQVAAAYDAAFAALAQVTPLRVLDGVKHAWHLYVVRIDFAALGTTRERAFAQLREAGIGVNVHYLPVHLHPYYRERFRTGPGLCPAAETAYEQILTLPMHFGLSDGDVQTVVEGLRGLGA
jgi:perosamine synthetase